MKLKIGDKVRLRHDSEHYSQAPDLVGEITEIQTSKIHPYEVRFSNKYTNTYEMKDLGKITTEFKIGDRVEQLDGEDFILIERAEEKDEEKVEKIEVGDLVETKDGDKCIVRYIGELDGYGTDFSAWGVWSETGEGDWNRKLVPRSKGGQLGYSDMQDCKLIRKGVKSLVEGGIRMGKYEEIKGRIEKLGNGWDKGADDILNEIGDSYRIEISQDKGGSYGEIIVQPKRDRQLGKVFKYRDGQCNKMKAFKEALLYILDNSDIQKEEGFSRGDIIRIEGGDNDLLISQVGDDDYCLICIGSHDPGTRYIEPQRLNVTWEVIPKSEVLKLTGGKNFTLIKKGRE